ncbi:hypothetical protein GCM10010371_62360 [Streptomyces subrutilus]|uniref:Uncharacterized protein n=1 Tax=Streptomyces subrutilus TaxID=36818 RepID=A0A918RGI1_9ACTN|nr:hypothetical protein GCM10010371_62360 [Streptomyces subrutilus]
MLERYLAHLHADYAGRAVHRNFIGQLNLFFLAIRQHRRNDALPASTVFFPEDFPRYDERLPRALSEPVMTQLEQPVNLDRWKTPAYRLVTLISDALRPADHRHGAAAARLHRPRRR